MSLYRKLPQLTAKLVAWGHHGPCFNWSAFVAFALLNISIGDNDGSSRETTGVPFAGLEYGTATQNDSLSRSLVHVFQEYPLVSVQRALRKDMESSRRHECG